jgi:hypothetical protein
MIFRLGLFLCKNHPLDDLQEKNLLVKEDMVEEIWCWSPPFQFSPVKVFGRPDSMASHCLVGGSSLKDFGKC